MKSLHLNVSVEGEEGGGGRGDDAGKSHPPATFLSALEGIKTGRKYLMKFNSSNNMMAALSSIENKVFRDQ
jgi:hypothetical protein